LLKVDIEGFSRWRMVGSRNIPVKGLPIQLYGPEVILIFSGWATLSVALQISTIIYDLKGSRDFA